MRPKSEVFRAFLFQRSALQASGSAYDTGERWEALRIANAVFMLVHDGGRKARSILGQLGVRGSLKFASSGIPPMPGNLAPEAVLASMRIWNDGRAEYVPWLNRSPVRLVQFHHWWEKEIIYRDGDLTLNRRRLVFALRNQEGGAHLDASLTDDAYVRMTRAPLTKLTASAGGHEPVPFVDVELASMRQIGWELLQTIEPLEMPRSGVE